jgi:hypothetical protein
VPPPGKSALETFAALRAVCPWPLADLAAEEATLLVAPPPSKEELELLLHLDPDGQARTRTRTATPVQGTRATTANERGNA